MVAAIICWPTVLLAAEITVFPGQNPVITTGPRQVLTLSYRLMCDAPEPIMLDPELERPIGWDLVAPLEICTAGGGRSCLVMAHLLVPENAQAGGHRVRLVALDRSGRYAAAYEVTTVRVEAHRDLELRLVEMPRLIVAGRDATLEMLARNLSNVELLLQVTTRSAPVGTVTADPGQLRLEPGGTATVRATLHTDPALPGRQTTVVTVELQGEPDLRVLQSAPVEVLPRVARGEPATRSVPARLSMALTGDANHGHPEVQLSLIGGGALDPQGTHSIRFRLIGPTDTFEQSSLGRQSEYLVAYQGPSTTLSLGDQAFSLSRLTEQGRWGRGVQARLDRLSWGLDGFAMRTRFGRLEERALAAWLGSQDRLGARLSVLDKSGPDEGRLADIEAWYTSDGLHAELEHGRTLGGSNASGLRLAVSGGTGPLLLQAELVNTDPGFAGQSEDRSLGWARVDLHRPSGATIWGSYRRDRMHTRDPRRIGIDEDEVARAGLTRPLGRARLSLELEHLATERRSSDDAPGEWWQLDVVRVAFSRRLGSVSVLTSLGLGTHHGRAADASGTAVDGSLFVSWQPGAQTWTWANATYRRNLRELGEPELAISVGASAHLGPQLTARCELQRSEEEGFARSHTGLGLVWELAHHRSISLQARRSPGEHLAYLLEYTMPLEVPLLRRRDLGSLGGRVVSAETSRGLEDAVVTLLGLTAVTDRQGRFRFEGVAVGSHLLTVELGDNGAGLIALNTPLLVDIRPRDSEPVTVLASRGASVTGRVTIWRGCADRLGPEQDAGSSLSTLEPIRLSPAGPAAGVLVVLDSGTETLRRLTDADGRFEALGLPPGRWHLTLDPDSLPAGLAPGRPSLELALDPVAPTDVQLRLVPRQRTIRLQNGGDPVVVEDRS